jgi:hypothetical protein
MAPHHRTEVRGRWARGHAHASASAPCHMRRRWARRGMPLTGLLLLVAAPAGIRVPGKHATSSRVAGLDPFGPPLRPKQRLGTSVTVTTPFEIIPYYRLNHSIWSLSDKKESSRWVLLGLRSVITWKHREDRMYALKLPRRRVQSALQINTNFLVGSIITNHGSWHKRKSFRVY